ncbi:hypothetical protein [Caenimonas aquaedulcis]|uniref:Uncharacterized protein n=1 Tax=Caenimonas aquaedulcis TaxID=2793270 RepID=A0A931H6U9_9BURK|nr:hypothetical protein [Caenimonas aquaedulcis]MBG9389751.1 hypothetical protein [Caenimonas aquaedulcis]
MADDQDRTASLMTPAKLAQAQSRPRAAASPAAWLDQMASDAGHAHVRRLAELREQMQTQAATRDYTQVSAGLSRLGEALPALDFNLLQARGWWARTTGKSRTAGAEFAAQFERIEAIAKELAAQAVAAQKQQQDSGNAADLSLVELEVEFRAIEKIIDQGARWLQDMRNQLKTRQAEAGGDAQTQQAIEDDAARCEILVARLKLLRAVSSAAQQSHQQAQAAAGRRVAFGQMLQQKIAPGIKTWLARISTLASAAGDEGSPALSLEGPMECHRDLQLAVKQATADCSQLQLAEKAVSESLDALDAQLEPAR